jgi:hypothetical protein
MQTKDGYQSITGWDGPDSADLWMQGLSPLNCWVSPNTPEPIRNLAKLRVLASGGSIYDIKPAPNKHMPCCKPWHEAVEDRTFIYYPECTTIQPNPEGWAVTEPGSVIIYGMKFCPFCGATLTPPPAA